MYLKDFTTLIFGLNPNYQLYFQSSDNLVPITQFSTNAQAAILLADPNAIAALDLKTFFSLSNQLALSDRDILINYNSDNFKVFGYRISEGKLLINGKLQLVNGNLHL
ncbi:hypothetical protein QS460_00280 [Liquorilactobacillus mali]|uniref:hypothetical protein n=1 Tax=Liquorilactobacillus mali TaxID=1618 RepID=UPI0007050177|nr:hypothetical protein [Liquorilactobacillus mali]MDN7144352.1 hypothetical protein [Liquorilactobacillus mali]